MLDAQNGYAPEMAGAPVTVISKLLGRSGSHAIRIGLLNRLGHPAEAAGAYESALAVTENAAERPI